MRGRFSLAQVYAVGNPIQMLSTCPIVILPFGIRSWTFFNEHWTARIPPPRMVARHLAPVLPLSSPQREGWAMICSVSSRKSLGWVFLGASSLLSLYSFLSLSLCPHPHYQLACSFLGKWVLWFWLEQWLILAACPSAHVWLGPPAVHCIKQICSG